MAKWEGIAKSTQAELAQKIPAEWRLPESILVDKPRNVQGVFASCGLLSVQDLAITDVEDCVTLLEKIHSGQWTAEEVTTAFCKRAAIAQQLINPLMDIAFEEGIRRARELDEHFKRTGNLVGPLHGLPVSLKDLTDVKGMRITLGFIFLADKRSSTDAIAVQALRGAGAVVYCKTTMPQSGMALETRSNLFGRTLNPFNTALTSGGSSGGEGALNGCHGAPVGIATDIGGSIRGPATFNGLYGIRPSSRRFSYQGNAMGFTGQAGILSSIGPVGRSLRDIELILRVWNQFEPWLYDPVAVAKKWNPLPAPSKATIGVMSWDEVVMPHPPIQRAIREVVGKLKAAGHEVVEYKPYKHDLAWDIAFQHYFATGGKMFKDLLGAGEEPAIPSVGKFLKQAKELSVHELTQAFKDQRQYQIDYLAHWNATARLTSTGRPVDAILAPAMGSASFPHDYLPWWGYLAQWNLLDYPCIMLPVTKVQMTDIKDSSYQPVNDRDRENYDLYDPSLFVDAPVGVQLIGRSMQEEELLATAMAVDGAIKEGR